MASLFLACCALGTHGTIPYLPEELRRRIHRELGAAVGFRCRSCARVLCVARVRSESSYQDLLRIERVCLGCFCEAASK